MLAWFRSRLTFANVVSLLALFFALGGGAYALTIPKNSVGAKQLKKNAVRSSKIKRGAVTTSKVKDQSLLANDFKPGQLPAGPPGAAGLTGPPGPEGPSHAYSTGYNDNAFVNLEETGTEHTLMSLTVPEGSYAVIARLQGVTVTDPDGPPLTSYRYDCRLRGGTTTLDNPTARVGQTAGVESYLTYEGAFTGAGPITLNCRAANGHPLTALSGRMVAIRLGALN